MNLKTLSEAELTDWDASVSNSTDFLTFDLAQVAPRLQIWKNQNMPQVGQLICVR